MINRFDSVPLDEKQKWNINLVKSKAEELDKIIEESCYEERCKEKAITSLEEFVMWATKGISRTKYED